jgi:hypothetical protein
MEVLRTFSTLRPPTISIFRTLTPFLTAHEMEVLRTFLILGPVTVTIFGPFHAFFRGSENGGFTDVFEFPSAKPLDFPNAHAFFDDS